MPTYEDYERDYRAGDRDEVLENIRKYGTDDRSQWNAGAPTGGQQSPYDQISQVPGQGQPPPQAGRSGAPGNQYQNIGQVPGSKPTGGGGSAPTGNREDFKAEWMASGNDVNRQNEILKKYGVQLDAAGRGRIPGGDLLDLRIGAKAGINQAGWTAVYDPMNPGASPGGWGPPGPPGAPPPGNPGGPPPPGASNELYKLLMDRAKQGTKIDPNDPNIRQQVDPYAAAQERERRNYLADMAERSGPGANLRGESRLASERAGQATGMFQSQLIGRELQSRRDEIQNALSMWSDRLTEDQRQALQRELGYLNDATQRYGIDQQTGLGWGQIDLGRGQLGRDIGRDEMDFWLRSQGM